jgi:hypothetical protein
LAVDRQAETGRAVILQEEPARPIVNPARQAGHLLPQWVLVASTETEPLSEQKRDLFSSLNSLAGWV